MPDVRQELLTTLKTRFIPLGVLDEFQSAGVFVNWWQQIRYDLKTIISTGWHHTLIPDSYLIAAFFQAEADAIEALEASISEAQSELAEAVEAGQELAAYEPEEDESVTAATIKAALKELIDDLKDNSAASAKKELKALLAQEKSITLLEKRIKDSKAELKTLTDELELKLQLKRLGDADFKAENETLLARVQQEIQQLQQSAETSESPIQNPKSKIQNSAKLKALQRDGTALEARLAKTDALFAQIGGKLTDEQARTLILTKLHDLASHELNRYLNAAKRQLIQLLENLWDKYAVSSRALESERSATLQALDGFLTGLGYLK
jgi:type I restriction enzyme M protein